MKKLQPKGVSRVSVLLFFFTSAFRLSPRVLNSYETISLHSVGKMFESSDLCLERNKKFSFCAFYSKGWKNKAETF